MPNVGPSRFPGIIENTRNHKKFTKVAKKYLTKLIKKKEKKINKLTRLFWSKFSLRKTTRLNLSVVSGSCNIPYGIINNLGQVARDMHSVISRMHKLKNTNWQKFNDDR